MKKILSLKQYGEGEFIIFWSQIHQQIIFETKNFHYYLFITKIIP